MKMKGINRVICTAVPWNECHSCGSRCHSPATGCLYRLVQLGSDLTGVTEKSRHVHINEMQFGGSFVYVCVFITLKCCQKYDPYV